MPKPKFRITQTLLSSYGWMFKKENGYEEFLRTLNRQETPVTDAILNGQRFENLVNATLDGNPIHPNHEWYNCVTFLGDYLWGSQQQVSLFREIEVDGVTFVLHGVLDFLRNGIIYDTKFSERYGRVETPGIKYLDSPQTPMYLALVPNAKMFEYVICDGEYIYREDYTRDDVRPIEAYIKEFMRFLDRQNLVDTYCDLWEMSKYKER